MSVSLERLRETPHLSVSALKAWLACPRRFRLKYLDRAPASHRPSGLIFGKCWHELLGHVLLTHQRGQRPTLDELRRCFAQALEREIDTEGPPVLFEEGEDLETLTDTAMRMLSAFLSAVALPDRLLHVELPFRFELTDPETGEVLPLPLIGAIDAVVGGDGQIELWEFKSGKRRWSEDAVLYDFQPTAYRMAMVALRQPSSAQPEVRLKLIVTTKAAKPDVQVEQLVRTARDERDLFITAASVHRAIEVGCFHPVRSWACKGCEYADVCD